MDPQLLGQYLRQKRCSRNMQRLKDGEKPSGYMQFEVGGLVSIALPQNEGLGAHWTRWQGCRWEEGTEQEQ